VAKIYDLNGRLFGDYKDISEGLNIKNLPSGRFFIHLKDANGKVFSKAFIKK
jgi:hypothetical protein